MLSSYEAPQFSELFVAYAMLTVVRLPPASGFPDVAIDNKPNILLTDNKNVVPVRTRIEVKNRCSTVLKTVVRVGQTV
ncbi:hypothetical protein [Cedecea sp. NFIX57]|uniref:hypothetical protein n=1 Tax=Cedecea sp. NFIX57 TaxID=1566286 RepID=UPI000A0A5681|nr:hypothetical protein [Cedecea sp. NFIX57]SMG61691.1 hypothetical protein SAMN03159353_10536 [Cedecea sp. NFIX57]